MITTKQLKFLDILEYPNMSIDTQKMNFLTGKSGVGKSAFLKMLNRSNEVKEGTLYIDGIDITHIDPIQLRQDYLLCGQNVFLFNGSIQDNFNMFYELRDMGKPSLHTIGRYLKMVCSTFSPQDKVDSMSGGERQRIYLALFVSMAKKVLLLDEPTSALDRATGEEVLCNIKAYCKDQGIGSIIISHDDVLAKEFADHIIHLENIRKEVYHG